VKALEKEFHSSSAQEVVLGFLATLGIWKSGKTVHLFPS